MGTYVCVIDGNGRDYADWDVGKHAGDREFALMCERLPHTDLSLGEGDRAWRPTDFAAWRQAICKLRENRSRFLSLLSLIESRPDLWIFVSW
jgi:hypothetical protein